MAKSVTSAAANLLGLTLEEGWKVIQQVAPGKNSSGSTFSHAYVVEKNGQKGFLKAFDFSDAFEPGQDTIEFLKLLTSAYEHERDLLSLCQLHKMSRVVRALGDGYTQVPGFDKISGRVYYLIFEAAEGDIRRQIDETKRFDTLWSLKALRDVCLGLSQIHQRMIAHQDVKPSNVLTYDDGAFRISDFGRASLKGRAAAHDEFRIAGDRTYAPPELIYGFTHADFHPRRMGCDVYMLGNLAAFLFSGVNVTASLLARLDPQFHPQNWSGTYDQVLPVVQDAFSRVLLEIDAAVDPEVKDFVIQLIRETCNPDLAQRGHSRGIGHVNQYTLDRYVSQIENYAFRYGIKKRAAMAAQ